MKNVSFIRCEKKITSGHSFEEANRKIFLNVSYKQNSNISTVELIQGGEYL